MNRVPDSGLSKVPGGTLITTTAEEGRALAFEIARHTVHNIQPDLDILMSGRPVYAADPGSLIAASHVVAVEFATIAAANNYWRARTAGAAMSGVPGLSTFAAATKPAAMPSRERSGALPPP